MNKIGQAIGIVMMVMGTILLIVTVAEAVNLLTK